MKKYEFYLQQLIYSGFSVLIKKENDNENTNNLFDCIKIRIFTVETITYKDAEKKKGYVKDFYLTIQKGQGFLAETSEVLESFCLNELKHIKNEK